MTGPAPLPGGGAPPDAVVDALLDLLDDPDRGGAAYGEGVSQRAHAAQAAALADAAGAPPTLVAAAILHDLGHLLGPPPAGEDPSVPDDRHEDAGARVLARWFPAAVTEPVRLHVAAKRVLCAAEPGYGAALSSASTASLAVQGGPADPATVAAFRAGPHAGAALALRRWDDHAKDPAATPPAPIAHRELLLSLLRRPGGR